MNITMTTIARALAEHLAPVLPGVTFFEDPNQQGTKTPCLFLQPRYAQIRKRQAGRYLWQIALDLTYLADYHLPNLQQIYLQAAETLDEVMETFPYSDGADTTLLRTYDRQWNIDLDALHYKFELRVWVEQSELSVPMQTMEYNEVVT